MHEPLLRQHAPVGQMNGVQPKDWNQVLPGGQLAWLVMVQMPVIGLQHAPGQALGLQLVPAPIQLPKAVLHCACVSTAQVPITRFGLQHAPTIGQGLGLQVPKGK